MNEWASCSIKPDLLTKSAVAKFGLHAGVCQALFQRKGKLSSEGIREGTF